MTARISSFCSGGDCVRVELLPDGSVKADVNRWPHFALVAEPAEWDAFIAGAKAGEFDRVALR